MKHLFVARHGSYGKDGRINDAGREQMKALAAVIKGILVGSPAHIVSSTASRALDSAQVLAEELGLSGVEQELYIWGGGDAPKDSYYNDRWRSESASERLIEIVYRERSGADTVIVVSHCGTADWIDYHVCEKESIPGHGKPTEIPKGRAIHFDMENKTRRLI
ncbi:MAG: phosphoglycerate mutase family protein [Candidatus Woesearchaeota archaeon]